MDAGCRRARIKKRLERKEGEWEGRERKRGTESGREECGRVSDSHNDAYGA